MSVTKSNQNNLTSPDGNSLAVFVDINDNALKLKDINGNVEGFTTYLPPTPLTTGLLQLQGGVALSSTLTAVTDQNNTTSPLKLSTTGVQIESPLRITTSDASGFYLDAEDSATNNRFSIKRDPSSQEVTLDFASNPTGTTTLVGAIRTYRDGTNLSNAMSFIEDGSVGLGTDAPIGLLDLFKSAAATRLAIRGDAGQNRLISYRTGAVQRFGLYVNNTAESGSNAGSNFAIRAYSDAGTLLSTPFFINRATGNVGINTLTGTAKLQVVGSGSTGATSSLLVQNSAGTTALEIFDSLTVRSDNSQLFFSNSVPTHRIGFFQFNGATLSNLSGTLQIQGAASVAFGNALINYQLSTDFNIPSFIPNNDTRNGISFAGNFTNSGAGIISTGNLLRFNTSLNTSIGTVTLNQLSIINAINTTGGTTLQRGFYYNPTLTGTVGFTHNAIETVTGNVLLNTTSGNTLIGASPSNTAKLSIKGSGSTSATTSFLVKNSSGDNLLKVLDDGKTAFGNSGIDCTIKGTAGNKFEFYAFNGYDIVDGFGNVLVTGLGDTIRLPRQVGIGFNTQNDASAILQADSTTKGFLPPRMTTAQKVTLAATAVAGLMIYDTDLNKLCVYTGAGWETITSV